MARYDLYQPAGALVLDVQSVHLDDFGLRVVVPIMLEAQFEKRIRDLHPLVLIEGVPHILVTHRLGSVPKRELGRPIGSLAEYHDDIIRALDVLFTGF